MNKDIVKLETIEATRKEVSELKGKGLKVGFVPTMGYLHDGHLSLVKLARRYCDVVLASIFVNPTQFNDPKDLEAYPRDLPRDFSMLASVGTHGIFLPTPNLMYGPRFESWVEVQKLGLEHEGACRPGHFRGVSTVVSMLFNAVMPDVAVFGEKDFQQLRIIERMVDDLKFPIQIVRGPLIRESDGLAMSSRNVRLSPNGRQKALSLSRGLFAAREAFESGERDGRELCRLAENPLRDAGLKIDYVHLVDEESLGAVPKVEGTCRLLVAAFVDNVRLIDNIQLAS